MNRLDNTNLNTRLRVALSYSPPIVDFGIFGEL